MKKDCILLIAIFIFLYFFNVMTPMLNEDYSAVFVWPRGVPNLGELPENVQRVSTFSDFFNNVKNYYVSEGGRVPGSIPGGLFSLLGKAFFNPLNALMMIILIIEIYWITHEGRITFSFTSSNIFWIAFCLWSFNPSLIDSCLWMSGASNYLWMSVIVLAFLIPFVQNYYNSSMLQDSSFCLNTGIFVTGILAGWSHETTGCWLILILGYWLFICWKRKKFHLWKLFGYIGFCIGYCFLIFAPGNFTRLNNANEQVGEGLVFIGHSLFFPKLIELFVLLLFQLFLWHFMISFFLHSKKYPALTKIEYLPYLVFAKICFLEAIGSMAIMFLIPVSGWRPSFLSLVFLIIGVFSIHRVVEKANVQVIVEPVKVVLKYLGYSYLIMTIAISLYSNFLNWQYWNNVLTTINQEKQTLSSKTLEILPSPTDKDYWFWRFASGSHLIYVPIISNNEKDRINKIVAKYYGIKGIKVVYDATDAQNSK